VAPPASIAHTDALGSSMGWIVVRVISPVDYTVGAADVTGAHREFAPETRTVLPSSNRLYFSKFDATVSPAAGTNGAGPSVYSDRNDPLFGDRGNDWIVGGMGQDHAAGGLRDDLVLMDDDQTTAGGLNNRPGTSTSYEDFAYGGSGHDVLIGTTGGGRLIDWVGGLNFRPVPLSLIGADGTRVADVGTDPRRNGNLGNLMQCDFAWREQNGAVADLQPGNARGTAQDVLHRRQRPQLSGLRYRQRPGYFVRRSLPVVACQARRRGGGCVQRRRLATHLFRAKGVHLRRQADGRPQVQRLLDHRLPVADRLQVRRG
jgi:hypothetical protein